MSNNSTESKSSKKTKVIELLFEEFCPDGQTPDFDKAPMIVTNDSLVGAIKRRNELVSGPELSTANPANFLKDLIRKPSCNEHWPARLKTLKVTARQRYGSKHVFEFVSYRSGDVVPFPDRFEPKNDVSVHMIETLSLPKSARALGRVDEPWLTQVVVYQRILHFHFAVHSKLPIVDLVHLQMSVKTQPEIDAVFLATVTDKKDESKILVTCEAKQHGERILEDQIREQIQRGFKMTEKLKPPDSIHQIVPIAVAVRKHPEMLRTGIRGIYVAEFAPISRKDFETSFGPDKLHDLPLLMSSSALYDLRPAVKGVSKR